MLLTETKSTIGINFDITIIHKISSRYEEDKMKNWIAALFLSLAMVLGLTACSHNGDINSATAASGKSIPVQAAGGKALVVYFSVPEAAKPDNMNREEENSTVVIHGEVLGNTQYVAQIIQRNTGADIFRIESAAPYPMDHAQLEAVATKESREKALPEIAGTIANLEQYNTIFVGYPNWYGDLPRILYTFFNAYDLSGKTVIPFVTSGASGFSNTIVTIQNLQPNATVIGEGLSVLRNHAEDAEPKVISWLESLGFKK